jgi:hypothetical protein
MESGQTSEEYQYAVSNVLPTFEMKFQYMAVFEL